MCTYTYTEYVYTYKVINPGYNKGNNLVIGNKEGGQLLRS